jgi:hypothetical protein
LRTSAAEVDFRIPGAFTGPAVAEYPTGDGDGRDGDSYAHYTRALWDEQSELLKPLHETWVNNLNFFSSKQWLKNRNGQFLPDIVPDWREQPVTNLCVPYFKTFLSKATKIRPAWSVVPASSDPDDVHATALAEEVLEAKWTELKLGRVVRRAVGWTILTGNAFLYPVWNTRTGKMRKLEAEMDVPVYEEVDGEMVEVGSEVLMVPLDEDGEPKLGEDGRPTKGAEPHVVDQGDVGVRVLSPFQVRVNPEAEQDEDATWFMIGEVMTLREIQQVWPDAFDSDNHAVVMAEDVDYLDDYNRAFAGIMGGNQQSASPRDQRDHDLSKALVLFYHEIPTPEYPEGRYWVATKDVLLEKPGPLPEGVWPSLIHLQDLVVPGRYHAASTFEHIVELNREYNELNGSIKEHHNLFIRGKWLVPKGSGIRKGQITTQPGEVIQYNPGFVPSQMELKPLPAPVYNERQRVLDDYQLVGGIHQVSMGAPPPGVTAGVAFLQLQEADDTDLGPFLAMLEECIAELAGAVLQIIKERYTDERLVYVAGPNRKFQVRAFRGADLEGAVAVVPVVESSFPWSKTAKQSMLLTLAQQMPELFQDPETGQFDRPRFARMLPIGGLDQFANSEDIDVQEALNEEDLFASFGLEGRQAPQVEWWQNHEVHFNQHVRLLKSGSHLKWSPEAQQLFVAHVQETMQARDQKRAELNIANGGTPPGEQAPPGPGADPGQLMEQEGPASFEDALPVNAGQAPAPAAMEQQKMIAALEASRSAEPLM